MRRAVGSEPVKAVPARPGRLVSAAPRAGPPGGTAAHRPGCRLREKLDGAEGDERGLRRGLGEHGIAGGERGGDLAGEDGEREVPGEMQAKGPRGAPSSVRCPRHSSGGNRPSRISATHRPGLAGFAGEEREEFGAVGLVESRRRGGGYRHGRRRRPGHEDALAAEKARRRLRGWHRRRCRQSRRAAPGYGARWRGFVGAGTASSGWACQRVAAKAPRWAESVAKASGSVRSWPAELRRGAKMSAGAEWPDWAARARRGGARWDRRPRLRPECRHRRSGDERAIGAVFEEAPDEIGEEIAVGADRGIDARAGAMLAGERA